MEMKIIITTVISYKKYRTKKIKKEKFIIRKIINIFRKILSKNIKIKKIFFKF